MDGNNHATDTNTKRAIEKNRREQAGLQNICSRIDKDCKEKCTSLNAERARFLSRHQVVIPTITVKKSSPHKEYNSIQEYHAKLLLPPVTRNEHDGLLVSGRIRSISDVTPARWNEPLHYRQALSAKSYSTGTIHRTVKQNAQEHIDTAQHIHEHCSSEQCLVSRKTSRFKTISIPIMTFVVLSKSLNEGRRQLEALDLPFNDHIMRRKIQSERDLEKKLNEVTNLRYLRTGKYTTRLWH